MQSRQLTKVVVCLVTKGEPKKASGASRLIKRLDEVCGGPSSSNVQSEPAIDDKNSERGRNMENQGG